MGGKSKQTTTNQVTIDPTVMGFATDNYQRARALADTPVTPYSQSLNLSAPMATAQSLSNFYAPDVAATSYSPLTGAASTYGAQTGAATTYDALTGSASRYDPTLMNRGGIQNVDAGVVGTDQIAAFMNPYTSQVIDSSLGDVEKSRRMAINAGQARAQAAGAYGGSRHGVADSLTNGEFADTAASTAANLRSQGFNTALGAAQTEAARQLQAAMANQGVDLSVEQANAAAQNQAGQFNAGQQQAMEALNLGYLNQAAQTNAAQRQAMDLANLGFLNEAGQFNAGQRQAMDALNLQYGNQAAQWNADAIMRAALANQQAAIAGADVRAKGAGILGDLSKAEYEANYQEFLRQANDPFVKLGALNDTFRAIPVPQTQTSTSTSKPGLIDWVNAGANVVKAFGGK